MAKVLNIDEKQFPELNKKIDEVLTKSEDGAEESGSCKEEIVKKEKEDGSLDEDQVNTENSTPPKKRKRRKTGISEKF
jgi:uncharacterized membrane protein YukC